MKEKLSQQKQNNPKIKLTDGEEVNLDVVMQTALPDVLQKLNRNEFHSNQDFFEAYCKAHEKATGEKFLLN